MMESGYNGNKLLKRVGSEIEWTPEMVQELQRCADDPIHFIREHCRIVHVDRGLISFDLYDYQEKMINEMYDHRNTVILSCRQSGKCHCIMTMVSVRNKKTGEIEEITIGDLYERIERSSSDL